MSTGRTHWWAKDAGWWRREWIVELGEEFGPAGPAVIDWLACEAKAQNDGGFVKAGRKTVARGCFVDVVTVGHVLSRSVTLGLLEDFSEQQGRFTCRISGWRSDQDRAQAANRKAVQRANADDPSPESRSVTDVTESPLTGQDRTEVKPSSSEASPSDPKASEDDILLCRHLAAQIKDHNPKVKVKSPNRWLREMRLLRDRDGNDPAEIRQVIDWVFTSPSTDARFWASVIQSSANLREHYPKVWQRMTAKPALAVATVEDSAAFLSRRGAA